MKHTFIILLFIKVNMNAQACKLAIKQIKTAMKTKSIRNIFALTLILFTVIGCGRYEEGPLISFNAIENRITGTWYIDEFNKNNIDITSDWVNNYNWKFYFGCPDGCSNGVTMGFGITMTFVPDNFIPDSAISFYNEATYRFEDNFCKVAIFFNYRAAFSNFLSSSNKCNFSRGK